MGISGSLHKSMVDVSMITCTKASAEHWSGSDGGNDTVGFNKLFSAGFRELKK